MSIVYEQNLAGYPSSNSDPGLEVGQTVIGSLTSRTDTYDNYNLIINSPMMVRVKFDVDQEVTVNDYYELNTPVGSFYIRPNYNPIPETGVIFFVAPNSTWSGTPYYDDFTVRGSSSGVFRESYSLEINSVPSLNWGRLLPETSDYNNPESVAPNDVIIGWDGFYSGEKWIETFIPSVGDDELVTVIIRNNGTSSYGATSTTPLTLDVNVFNEGLREIHGELLTNREGAILSNIQSGRGYFFELNVYDANGRYSISSNPTFFNFNLEFWTEWGGSRKTTINSPGNDAFGGYTTSIDTVVYDALHSSYNLTSPQTSGYPWTIANKTSSERDTAFVDRLQFSDKSVALDIDGTAGKGYRVYKAAFNREPDHSGLGYWIAQMDEGMDMVDVAARFIDSDEFRSMYGTSPSDADFLTKVYQNVLGRDPEATGYNWWLNEIQTNPDRTRAKVLADFSESAENIEGTAELIANGVIFDAWIG